MTFSMSVPLAAFIYRISSEGKRISYKDPLESQGDRSWGVRQAATLEALGFERPHAPQSLRMLNVVGALRQLHDLERVALGIDELRDLHRGGPDLDRRHSALHRRAR